MVNHKQLETYLMNKAFYPDVTEHVEHRETHISHVYLTDHYAYKFKKCLQLPFLNYSTLEDRREACLAELVLNRRFADDVYLDVVAVCRDGAAGYSWNQTGNQAGLAVEYAVRMRRIPDQELLDHRIQDGRVGQEEFEQIAQHLMACYARLPRAHLDPQQYVQNLARHIEENRTTLFELCTDLHLDPVPWMAVSAQQSLYLRLHEDQFEQRVRQARVLEGHGDLRPEHIAVNSRRVAVLDGIEFSRDLRTLDLADELSFLAMEWAALNESDLGRRLRDRVLQALGDAPARDLLAFYEAYRATVRAKVNLMRALQLEGPARDGVKDRARRYLDLARQSLQSVHSGFVFVVTGAMGSGKTSLARALRRDLGAEHVESDELRRECFGASERPAGFGEGPYRIEDKARVYEAMRERLASHLEAGMPVILDGSFGQAQLAKPVLDCLSQAEVPYLIIVCDCPDPIAMERIRQRMRHGQSHSEARPDIYLQHKRECDWSFPGHPVAKVFTLLSLEHQLHEVYRAARKQLSCSSL